LPEILKLIKSETLILKNYNEWLEKEVQVPVFYNNSKMYHLLEKRSPKLFSDIHRYKHTTSGINAIAIALDCGATSVSLYGITLEESQRWECIAKSGQIVKYDPVQLRKCHLEPADEIEILKRVMKHYPVALGNSE
jgi:hypothetical protein